MLYEAAGNSSYVKNIFGWKLLSELVAFSHDTKFDRSSSFPYSRILESGRRLG
jgi:hypothetical protein